MPTVITSVPLQGPTGQAGSDAAEAAGLAAADRGDPVEHVVLDSGADRLGEHVRDNALGAAADPDVVGYLGEFHSAATEVSLPLLEAAGIPHVSFSNTFRRLAGASFVNVMPNDERAAAAVTAWMLELGVRAPFLIDDGEDYGADTCQLVHRELVAAGVSLAGAGRFGDDAEPPRLPAGADAIFLGAVASPVTVQLLERLHDRTPGSPVFGMDGLVADVLAARLAPETAERLHVVPGAAPAPALPAEGQEVAERLAERVGHPPDPHAVYSYEAMALLLDALAEVGPDRAAIIATLRGTRGRESAIGRYDVDDRGATTLPANGRLRIVNGRFTADE